MIKLYNFGQFGDLPDPSAFCVKIDVYLRMTGLPFTVESGIDNLKRAPKGKLPFIEDDGEKIADSSFIIEYLKQKYGDSLDAELTEVDKAIVHAFSKMMDENLYWCLVWCRWASDQLWPQLKESFFGGLPPVIRDLAAFKVRKGVIRDLQGQGVGRHSEADIRIIMTRDLKALSAQLGDKSYFMGDRVSSLDAVAYGFLSQFVLAPLRSPMTDIAMGYPNLVSFCHRIQRAYYLSER